MNELRDILISKMLKAVFKTTSHVILNLVNTAIQNAIIWAALKVIKFVPIPKVNNTVEDVEFTAINTLVIEKDLELVRYNKILENTGKNEIIF